MAADPRPQRVEGKPIPKPSAVSQPFWDACNKGTLVIPECQACHQRFFYPRLLCPRCGEMSFDWIECSGFGSVWSFTTMRMSFWGDAFADDVPYNVSWIKLDEGVRIISNVIGISCDEVRIGSRVHVEFEEQDGFMLPKFRPIITAS
jgi:hypothetical protein